MYRSEADMLDTRSRLCKAWIKTARVIYIGALSMLIFPSLRPGGMVVPKDLTDVLRLARKPSTDRRLLGAQGRR
ncbi:MAG: hypothetical protein H0U18_04885 [Pyrinomonadaceae bacterium]|nr:hypothetical protein [Pyrinomonadaceae bacterium]